MNVDIRWAKQRPHFLAEFFDKYHDSIVFYPYSFRIPFFLKKESLVKHAIPIVRLPFGSRFEFIRKTNKKIYQFTFSFFLKDKKFDLFWVSSPELYEFFPKGVSRLVIYDCMDDYISINKMTQNINMEKCLIDEANFIFCSSDSLRNKIINRGCEVDNNLVLYNAFDSSLLNDYKLDLQSKPFTNFTIGYIGTISHWFDFEAVNFLAKNIPESSIVLIGPLDGCTKIPKICRNIVIRGSVPHSQIMSESENFDLMIMPFKNSKLIDSVDPVKFYEYIAMNKPIISIKYDEVLNRYKHFVDFYSTKEELVKLVRLSFINKFQPKYNQTQRSDFLSRNSWNHRFDVISETISSLLKLN